MPSLAEAIQAHVAEEMRRRAAVLEALLAEAMVLQDFDRLDQLAAVHQDGCGPAVASLLDSRA